MPSKPSSVEVKKKRLDAIARKIEKETGYGIPQCFTCRKILTRGGWIVIEKTVYAESGDSRGGTEKQYCIRCGRKIKI